MFVFVFLKNKFDLGKILVFFALTTFMYFLSTHLKILTEILTIFSILSLISLFTI